MTELSFTEVGEILRLLQGVEATHVELEWGDLKLQVSKAPPGQLGSATAPPAVAPVASTAQSAASEQAARQPPTPTETGPGVAGEATGEATGTRVPEHWVPVTAPMAGTFYRSPKPGEPAYVEVGDTVAPGDTVALVEVMKLFTELTCDVAGKVARVAAHDAVLVEFGQALVWIEPA